jgi:uncharacterized protein
MSDPLSNLYLLVSQECNLACKYCYAAGGHFGQGAKMMPGPVMRRALELLWPRVGEHLTLSFFGGEPLLNLPLLREAILCATRLAERDGKSVSFALTTNGVLLGEEALDLIAAHVAYLSVSLDGDPAANEGRVFLDGRAAFEAVAQNLARLRERGLRFALRGTITPGNVDRLLDNAEYLAGLGAASVRLAPAEGIDWPPDARGRLLEAMVELNRRGLRALALGRAPIGGDHALRIAAHRVSGFSASQPCLAGGGVLAVSADGTVFPCDHFVGVSRFAMGNVGDPDFPGEPFARIEKLFAGCVAEPRSGCARCVARPACGGQCYAAAFGASGDIARPDPRFCSRVRRLHSELDPEVLAMLHDERSARALRAALEG